MYKSSPVKFLLGLLFVQAAFCAHLHADDDGGLEERGGRYYYNNVEIDPSGPRPMDYGAALQWDALRNGKAPTNDGAGHYVMPTDYESRQKYLEKYRRARRASEGWHY